MIIVSQDKTLIINFDRVESIGINQKNEVTCQFNDGGAILGIYKSKERAKEILIAIKSAYQASKMFENVDTVHQNEMAVEYLKTETTPYTYEMPKE